MRTLRGTQKWKMRFTELEGYGPSEPNYSPLTGSPVPTVVRNSDLSYFLTVKITPLLL